MVQDHSRSIEHPKVECVCVCVCVCVYVQRRMFKKQGAGGNETDGNPLCKTLS